MSLEADKNSFVVSKERSTSCGFQGAEEKEEIPGMGEDSVLEMLSYSKFTDLETWLCMPSTLLPRSLESLCATSQSLTPSETADAEKKPRPPEGDTPFLSPPTMAPQSSRSPSPIPMGSPVPSSLDSSGSSVQGGVSVRKRRRLAASPGGLRWNSSGLLQRDYDTAETLPAPGAKRSPGSDTSLHTGLLGDLQRATLTKSVSVDDRLFQKQHKESHKLLTRLERGKNKLRNIHANTNAAFLGGRLMFTSRLASDSVSSPFLSGFWQLAQDSCMSIILIKNADPQSASLSNTEAGITMNLR